MKARRSLLAALVVMSLVLLGVPRVGLAADLPSDVVGTKYEEAVRLLSGIGVMKGYNDLTFRPEAPVKRSEMAKILVYSLGLGGVGEASMGKTGYKDVSEDSWASGYVNVADTKGLIKGVGNDLFAPDRSVSYAEAATMLIRLLGRESEVAGSFPTGQIALAVRWGLTQDTAFMGDQPARRGDIALMVYKALYEIPDRTGKTLASTVFGFGRAARIEVTPATGSIAVGQTVQFQAVAYDAGGKAVAITPSWSVGGSLGIVDKTGVFIATGPGTGKITASAEGLTATADLTVYGTPVKLSVTASQTTMPSNNSSTSVLTATMLDANGNKVANGRGKITFTVIDASLGHMDASVIDAVDGVATATFTSTTIPGIEQIYVSGSNVQGASVTISTTSP
ncbi:MAG TPA: S-layer homology domain-containing protein, partial [Bacillota bacterium]